MENTHSPIELESCETVSMANAKCEKMSLRFHVDVNNIDNKNGSYVLFMFSTTPSNNIDASQKQLIDFKKVYVQAGAMQSIIFTLDVWKDLSIVDKTKTMMFLVGSRLIYIGDLEHFFCL